MQIPCISCQSLFVLDNDLVQASGSLVRCTICNHIFMVYPPALNEKLTVKDINVSQSILDVLLEVEQSSVTKGILDQSSDETNNIRIDAIASIEAFEEEGEDRDSKIEDIEYAELPDFSELEDMIDWDEPPDAENLSDDEKQFDKPV